MQLEEGLQPDGQLEVFSFKKLHRFRRMFQLFLMCDACVGAVCKQSEQYVPWFSTTFRASGQWTLVHVVPSAETGWYSVEVQVVVDLVVQDLDLLFRFGAQWTGALPSECHLVGSLCKLMTWRLRSLP